MKIHSLSTKPFLMPECGSALVDLVFVLDSSESVGLQHWNMLLNFTEKVITKAEVDIGRTRIGLVTYR